MGIDSRVKCVGTGRVRLGRIGRINICKGDYSHERKYIKRRVCDRARRSGAYFRELILPVVVAIVADRIVQTVAGKAGVDFGGFYFFGLLVTIWLILNECISILENVSEIGVPLSAFLLRIVQN